MMLARTKLLPFSAHLHLFDVLRLLALVPIQIGILLLEHLLFPLSHFIQDDLQSLRVNNTTLVDVSI